MISISCGGGVSCSSMSTPGILKFPSGSISGIYVFSSSSSASTPGNSTSHSYYLSPTPGASTSPMRQPCLSVKVRNLVLLLTNVLTQEITVSVMGIKSQFLRMIFLPAFNWTYICLGYSHSDKGRSPLGSGSLSIAWDLLLIHLPVLSHL